MNEKVKLCIVACLIGIILGASTATWIVGRNSARERAGYESTLADWERRNNELNNQLREARALDTERRKLDEERRVMDAEIERTLREGLGAISQARSDYERGLIQLRFAKDIFEVLRKRYDPAYHGAAPAVP